MKLTCSNCGKNEIFVFNYISTQSINVFMYICRSYPSFKHIFSQRQQPKTWIPALSTSRLGLWPKRSKKTPWPTRAYSEQRTGRRVQSTSPECPTRRNTNVTTENEWKTQWQEQVPRLASANLVSSSYHTVLCSPWFLAIKYSTVYRSVLWCYKRQERNKLSDHYSKVLQIIYKHCI